MPAISSSLTRWALPKLQGPERDAAILHATQVAIPGANSWSQDDPPPKQALEWAARHSDPDVRDLLVEDLYTKWLRSSRYISAHDFAPPKEWPAGAAEVVRRIQSEQR